MPTPRRRERQQQAAEQQVAEQQAAEQQAEQQAAEQQPTNPESAVTPVPPTEQKEDNVTDEQRAADAVALAESGGAPSLFGDADESDAPTSSSNADLFMAPLRETMKTGKWKTYPCGRDAINTDRSIRSAAMALGYGSQVRFKSVATGRKVSLTRATGKAQPGTPNRYVDPPEDVVCYFRAKARRVTHPVTVTNVNDTAESPTEGTES